MTISAYGKGHEKQTIYDIISISTDYVSKSDTTYTSQTRIFRWEPTKYGSIVAVYFEALIWRDGGATTVNCQLYNVTDTTAITGSELTSTSATAERVRSSDIKANMPSTAKDMDIQLKVNASNCYFSNAKLIVEHKPD